MQASQISRRPLSDHPQFPKLRTGEIFDFFFSSWVVGVVSLVVEVVLAISWLVFFLAVVMPIALFLPVIGIGLVAIVGIYLAMLMEENFLLGSLAAGLIAVGIAVGSVAVDDDLGTRRLRDKLRSHWHKLRSPCLWKLQLCLERRDERPRKLPPVLFIHGKSVYQAVDVRKGWVSCLDKGQSLQHFPRSECFLPGPQDMNLLVEYEAEREAAGAVTAE